jgi:NAD(P)-dependent dehydrogenase (short-subunit alcohol dehydrogenase family)
MERVVLITGCSSGVGRATAEAFLEEEWTVYATARNPADVEALGERGCELATLDVTDDGDVERVVGRVLEEEGRLDCLVNNAGYAQFGAAEDVPLESVRRQFEVNTFGPHRLTREVLPHMRERGDGTVVNVSSAAGRLAFPGAGAYCGSKFALEAMTDALRAEVADLGVDAVLVEPGPVETQFDERAASELETLDRTDAYESLYDVYDDAGLVGGGGLAAVEPEAVADVVVNAASATQPRARYPVGPVGRLASLARLLPDGLRDAAFSLRARL